MKRLRKIMLIDDDESTNFLNSVIIKRAKCADEVIAFKRAGEAIENLQNEQHTDNLPELILLDINMPLMDGWEFLDKISEKLERNKIPKIVMLTSSINPEDQKKAETISIVSEFRSKPLSFSGLDEIINRFF